MKKQKVLIVGAGFGGVTLAQKLHKSGFFDVVVFGLKNHFEYYPGLYRVLGEKTPFEVFVPMRYLLGKKGILYVEEKVEKIFHSEKYLTTSTRKKYYYDIVVICSGTVPADFGISGVFEYASFVTSLESARLSKKTLTQVFSEYVHSKVEHPLSLVVAGGGPTGVELCGELAMLAHTFTRTYGIDRHKVSIKLVQRDKNILPQLPDTVQKHAYKRLVKLGVHILTEHSITEVDRYAVLTDKCTIPYKMFFFTAGSRPTDVILENEFLLSQRKKVLVDTFFSASTFTDTYVIGDNAETTYSGLAQIAEQDGVYLAKYLIAIEQKKKIENYVPRKPIYVIPIGNHYGILGLFGRVYTGMIPWLLRYIVDARFFFFRLSTRDFLYLSFFRKLK